MNDNGSQYVSREIKDGVCTVTINRPEAKNALTKAMYAEIREAAEESERDPAVEVMVIKGSGGAFAVGGDLKEILEVLEGKDPYSITNYEEYLPFEAVRSLTKPTVAWIDGLCLGGGLTLALVCDISIASEKSRFAIPEAKVGIVDGHMPRLLRDRVPPAWLRYWMYTGNIFPAADAHAAGLITRVVHADQLEATVLKCVADLRASSMSAIKAIKRILNETRPLSPMTDANVSLLKPEVLKRLQGFAKR